MCDDNTGCTLMCKFDKDVAHKPTYDEMLNWLENESGLSGNYFEKIKRVKYEEDTGLEIIFNDTANCFIAIKQITYHVFYGKHGKCEMSTACPRGEFKSLYLKPKQVEILTKDVIVRTLKQYGEIIEMRAMEWREGPFLNYMPTGDVNVYMLVKRQLPDILNIGSISTIVEQLTYHIHHTNRVLHKLWDNCKTGKEVDYFDKSFELRDYTPGCRIVIKHDGDGAHVPSQRDVYEWLVRNSKLSQDYLQKIIAFKTVTPGEYEIVFQRGVNCLLAMQEIVDRSIYDSHNIYSDAEINCSKGRFMNVTLSLLDNDDTLLTREAVDEALDPYCRIIEFKRIQKTSVNPNTSEPLVFDLYCKVFMMTELPKTLKISKTNVEVKYAEAEPEKYDEEILRDLWRRIHMISKK